MSAPVREPDDGSSKDGPLNYAPKKVRHAEPDPNPAGVPPKGDAGPRSPAPEAAEPPWRRSKQRAVFAGDAGVAQLRGKLALSPDRLPEPPPPPSTGRKYAWAGRLAGIAVVAVVGVIGYRLGSAPPGGSPPSTLPPSPSNQQAPKRSVAYAPQPGEAVLASPAAANAIVLPSDEQRSRDTASSRLAVSPQLTVGAVRPQQADEAARLAVSAKDAAPNAGVVISGLAPGSTLSAGTPAGPNTWQLPADELSTAAVTPPRGFVGAMDLTLELRLADNTAVDRKSLQLEWLDKSGLAPPKSQPRQHNAAEIAFMMKSGADLMANGDISGARLMYQRLAEEGEALAAFALAETYDPLVLRKSNITGGITPDVALAQSWYEKAKALGSPVAAERLERLARLP